MRSRPATILATCLTLLLAFAIASQPAQARKFKVLHTFEGPPDDGWSPVDVLVLDSGGNLYGTTDAGGTGNCEDGCGTAFKMDKTGQLIWLHSFNGKHGKYPLGGVLRDATGRLFGTASEGGDYCADFSDGCGTVFRLNKNGKETVLYRFTGFPDGETPAAGLVADSAGNLYGTTFGGGEYDQGTVFKVDPEGNESILYSFCAEMNCIDGQDPTTGLIINKSGDVFGVAGGGLTDDGVIYKVSPKGKETVLYNFEGGVNGGGPVSVLMEGSDGNLYGTTQGGGNLDMCIGEGCGVVYKYSPHDGTEIALYAFCSKANCSDGERPYDGPLIEDAAGNFYGTTIFGGSPTCGDGGGCGVVFKLDRQGNETVLHTFSGGADGAAPHAGLTIDEAGNLYGTTAGGGDNNCDPGNYGCGVVFKITP